MLQIYVACKCVISAHSFLFFFFDSRAKLFKTYEMFNVVDVQVFDFKLIRQMTSGSCRSVMGLAKRGNLWHAWISSEIFTRVF